MDYKNKIYKKYISNHTFNLNKKIIGIDDIKKNFLIWDKYYKDFLPDDKNIKIIDVGCGNGGMVYWLHNLGYINSYGVDISDEQVHLANSLGIKNIIKYDFIDFLNKNKGWDVIFLIDVLEHFKKDKILEILELIYKSLNKKGILIIKTPNSETIFSGRYFYSDFTHEIIFNERSLMQLLKTVGFNNFVFKEESPVIHSFKSLIRFILWKIIRLFLNFYLLVETGQKANILTQNIIVIAYK